jgi:hypothetical protein
MKRNLVAGTMSLLALFALPPVATAAMLTTPAISGFNIITDGVAQCRVLNVSGSSPVLTVTMYANQTVVNTQTAQVLPSGGTLSTDVISFTTNGPTNPSHCICTVPNTSRYHCSFNYVSPGGAVTVIPGR